jgi:hypothetical protein
MTRRATWRALRVGAGLCLVLASPARSQDLDPRAYVHVPVNGTFLVWGLGVSHGGVVTDATAPATDIQATVTTPSIGAGRSFSLFGKTAQGFAALPFAWADVSGQVLGGARTTYRAGLSDMRFRFSVLVRGAPAWNVLQIARAPRRTILGASLTVLAPTGEVYPDKLINIGTHRWSFKPEFAVSQPIGQRWLLDTYAAVWFFGANDSFYPGNATRTQAPIGAFQSHLSYTVRRQLWLAFDATYYAGGRATIEGVERDDLQSNSRVGGTLVLAVGQRHSIKLAVSKGAIVRQGADFTTFSFGWQTGWIPRPNTAPSMRREPPPSSPR